MAFHIHNAFCFIIWEPINWSIPFLHRHTLKPRFFENARCTWVCAQWVSCVAWQPFPPQVYRHEYSAKVNEQNDMLLHFLFWIYITCRNSCWCHCWICCWSFFIYHHHCDHHCDHHLCAVFQVCKGKCLCDYIVSESNHLKLFESVFRELVGSLWRDDMDMQYHRVPYVGWVRNKNDLPI